MRNWGFAKRVGGALGDCGVPILTRVIIPGAEGGDLLDMPKEVFHHIDSS